MALYDNKLWLLSHIRDSFISTDDTGMSELVLIGDDLPKQLADNLDWYRDPDDSDDDEDDMNREPYEMHLDMDFEVRRQRSNTAVRLEKMDIAKKRAAKVKHIKWEVSATAPTTEELDNLFVRKDIKQNQTVGKKSLLSEQLEKCTNLPQNPYIEYAKFDGSAQIGILTRKYKIFLTMLPEEHRNYPMIVSCIATAKIEELIGFILLKCSTIHGDFPLKPVSHYGLYITEEDGEVDHDFPNLDPKECVAKFGFTCLGLVEHKQITKNVSFESSQILIQNESAEDINISIHRKIKGDEAKQITANMHLMKVHATAMEAPLYQSYRVYIVNKMRAKAEIQLGISGEKIEIDPLQQKNTKFTFVRQKPVSHHIDSVAWCEVTDTKSSGTTFRVVYSSSFGNNGASSNVNANVTQSPTLQTSTSFKHYDFEADHNTAEEIVQKINLILELRSSGSRKEYLASRERKQKRKTLHTNK
ncbi:hypothetical protein RN001_004475 [Aquatica leii]|uniref:Target of rapamycin complex 2 subunit MAPKAP1 n=1 Tax=Aquatica leii TaxID=1421715 RepID=A0AAN7PEI9_9COLE|nr:hypothetical protein RN001_004475 [Aquatica leii]